MKRKGGKGRNRRGQPVTSVTEEGYAISQVERLVKCGSPRCQKCRDGPSHGPYIYERFRDQSGRVRTRYRGKAQVIKEQTGSSPNGGILPRTPGT